MLPSRAQFLPASGLQVCVVGVAATVDLQWGADSPCPWPLVGVPVIRWEHSEVPFLELSPALRWYDMVSKGQWSGSVEDLFPRSSDVLCFCLSAPVSLCLYLSFEAGFLCVALELALSMNLSSTSEIHLLLGLKTCTTTARLNCSVF